MIKSGLLILAMLSATLQAADSAVPPVKRSADQVLLVYNAASAVSKAVADDYASKRQVKNVLAIRCVDAATSADNETVPLEIYASAIERPIRDYLSAHREIQFIVLTKGVPIRISGSQTGERPDHSPPDTPLRTCLDSQLAALDYKTIPGARQIQITGSGADRRGLGQSLLECAGTFLAREIRRVSRHPPGWLHAS